jgi:hypothetical protein
VSLRLVLRFLSDVMQRLLLSKLPWKMSGDREAPILSPEFPPTAGRTEILLELAPGNYSFFIYNDENGNGKLDQTGIRFPNEPSAFSRNYKLGMHKPSFEEFYFAVPPSGTTMTVRLN